MNALHSSSHDTLIIPIKFKTPATRQTLSGVRASCSPTNAPLSTAPTSTAGELRHRTSRYCRPLGSISGEAPSTRRSGAPVLAMPSVATHPSTAATVAA